MTGGNNSKVEILVHASAPSRGKDDRRYRALTSAYLNFEPDSYWRPLECEPEKRHAILDRELGVRLQKDYVSRESIEYQGDEELGSLPCTSTQKSNISPVVSGRLLESPHISFDSTSDNFDSPSIRHLLESVEPLQEQGISVPAFPDDDSWKTPLSVVEDSQPFVNQAIPELSSSTRVLELCKEHFNGFSSQVPRSISDASTVLVPSSPPLRSREGSAEYSMFPTTSSEYLPTASYSRASSQSGIILLQNTVTIHSAAKRPRFPTGDISEPLSSIKRQCVEFISSDIPPENTSFVQDTPINNSSKPIFSSSPTRHHHCIIRPPSPKASIDDLTPQSLLTPSLLKLAKQLSLQTRYQPRTQSRPLRPFERGYWSVSMREWEKGLRRRIWNAVAIYVRGGMAGWGVWASREGALGKGGENIGGVEEGEELRVYCWGEVVGHIYLVLYLVSERKIKGIGARWVDGEGNAVIVMDPYG